MADVQVPESCQNCCCESSCEQEFCLQKALKFARNLYIHGGNLVNWNRTKRKTLPTPSEELAESISSTLNSYLPTCKDNNNEQKLVNCKKAIRCVNSEFVDKVKPEERAHLKISVKIFVVDPKPSVVQDALFRAMCELGVDSIETLFLALPEISKPLLNLVTLKRFWTEMELLYDCGYVERLGICDLDKETLEQLYDWARVKPEINQVNLVSCCVMPKDLIEYSKEKEIQLFTHSDPQDLLTTNLLHEVMQNGGEGNVDVENWKPVWALRYSILVKCRGVIKNKGYIVSCQQDRETESI